MREQFEQQMEDIRVEVIAILSDISTLTRKAVGALLSGDHKVAKEILVGDDEFDRRTLAVEDKVLETIGTQFPVARDLRLLHSLAFIAMYEERMADLAANIAKTAARVSDSKGGDVQVPQTLSDLIQAQGNLVTRVIDATREALETNNLELALKLPELDEPIDSLYKQFFRELGHLIDEDEITAASKMVMSSRYLERIADNAIDIGERVVFLITGQRDAYDEIELADESGRA